MQSLKNKHSAKLGFVSFFGNALEFFEFTVYGVFAPFFSKLFLGGSQDTCANRTFGL